MTTQASRADLEQLKGITPKLIRFFEQLFVEGQSTKASVAGAVESTGALQNATVLTLSSNAAFTNERVLSLSSAFTVVDTGPGGELQISLGGTVGLNGGFSCTFNLAADTNLDLPTLGRVPSSADGPYADDTAAAAAGVAIGEWYAKTGGTVVWRQV